MKHIGSHIVFVFVGLAGLATAGHAQMQPLATPQIIPSQQIIPAPAPAAPDSSAAPTEQPSKQPMTALQALVENDVARYVDRRPEQEAVKAFYQARDFKPIWASDSTALARAQSAITYLHNVGGEGLDPRDYPTSDFTAALTDAQAAASELQLTGSVLKYARHASAGRVSFTRVSGTILYPSHAADPAKVLEQVASARNVGDVLASYEPQQPGFLALKAALAKELSRDATLDPVQGKPGGLASRGESGRFRQIGDRSSIKTIVANMERWRWLPRDLGRDHVVVNVPDFTLAVYRDGKSIWRTKIVVGKPGRLSTPLLSETMKYLTINPTWNVPPSIIRNEYLPALERDPDALERIGLRVGHNPDGSLRVYQPPGEHNALGRIRFNFPNPFLVYQHDTPDRKLFARDDRALSHGCMRVQDPERYAEILLSLSQPEQNITEARIRGYYGSEERTIKLENPIPVHITYQTAFVDGNGQLEFRRDLYGLDAAILKLMQGNERSIADTPVARHYNSSSKPVMARLPERQWRDNQNEFSWNGREWGNRGWSDRGSNDRDWRADSSYGSYPRNPNPFGRMFGFW